MNNRNTKITALVLSLIMVFTAFQGGFSIYADTALQTAGPESQGESPDTALQAAGPESPGESADTALQTAGPESPGESADTALQAAGPESPGESPDTALQTAGPESQGESPDTALQTAGPESQGESPDTALQTAGTESPVGNTKIQSVNEDLSDKTSKLSDDRNINIRETPEFSVTNPTIYEKNTVFLCDLCSEPEAEAWAENVEGAIEDGEEYGYIVKMKENTMEEDGLDENSAEDGTGGICPLEYAPDTLTADSMETIVENVPLEDVEYIEPDYLFYLDDCSASENSQEFDPRGLISLADAAAEPDPANPNDPYWESKQWYLRNISVPALWTLELEGQRIDGTGNTTVAVIDSGVLTSHDDFQGIDFSAGRNYYNNPATTDLSDSRNHGTAVASLISARKNNGKGIAGICQNANLLIVKGFDGNSAKMSRLVDAIYYAVQQDADVINMSFTNSSDPSTKGMDNPYKTLRNACDEAADAGVILVAAGGNYKSATEKTAVVYPAAYDSVIGVGSVDSNNNLSSFSRVNEDNIFVCAPGTSIMMASSNGNSYYAAQSGTSFASPIAAGVLAMAKSADPSITLGGIKEALIATSRDLGDPGQDAAYGYGLINADKLVRYILEPTESAIRLNFSYDEDVMAGNPEITLGAVHVEVYRADEKGLPVGLPIVNADTGESSIDFDIMTGTKEGDYFQLQNYCYIASSEYDSEKYSVYGSFATVQTNYTINANMSWSDGIRVIDKPEDVQVSYVIDSGENKAYVRLETLSGNSNDPKVGCGLFVSSGGLGYTGVKAEKESAASDSAVFCIDLTDGQKDLIIRHMGDFDNNGWIDIEDINQGLSCRRGYGSLDYFQSYVMDVDNDDEFSVIDLWRMVKYVYYGNDIGWPLKNS